MLHSPLLSHNKFMLHKLRPPRFSLSRNSRSKRGKKDPFRNPPITNRSETFYMEVQIQIYSVEGADKACSSARQWRARGLAANPSEHGRRTCEVSARPATSRAKPRHRGAGCRRCVDAIEFELRGTADAKGSTRRRPDATDE